MTDKTSIEAIVLAGGLGTRLRQVVADRPKALSEVAGKPFVGFVIDYLLHQGVTHFIFSLGYMAEQIVAYIQKEYPSLDASFSVEDTPLGTGGAILKSLEQSRDENVLIVNADTYFDIDLQKLYAQHLETGADCTFALKQMFHFERYGAVEIDQDRMITSFKEKTFREEGYINGGYILLKKKTFEAVTFPEVFSFEKDFIEPLFQKLKLYGFPSDGYFIDIGIPADYEQAQIDFIKQ